MKYLVSTKSRHSYRRSSPFHNPNACPQFTGKKGSTYTFKNPKTNRRALVLSTHKFADFIIPFHGQNDTFTGRHLQVNIEAGAIQPTTLSKSLHVSACPEPSSRLNRNAYLISVWGHFILLLTHSGINTRMITIHRLPVAVHGAKAYEIMHTRSNLTGRRIRGETMQCVNVSICNTLPFRQLYLFRSDGRATLNYGH